MMIHLAMDDLPAWEASAELRDFNYVHIGGFLSDMTIALAQAQDGLLPVSPTIAVGQPTVSDPSRAPEGKHVLWVMVRAVPTTIRGDAASLIDTTDWGEALEPYADRVVDLIEEHAPGIRKLIRQRAVLGPPEIEAVNANLVGGDMTGGSATLMQSFFLRPVPGWSRYRTPIERLSMCGAATSPGSGVHAISGYLLGKQLLADSRGLRDRLGRW
jgi:phytoene dehydrogenase-like protein